MILDGYKNIIFYKRMVKKTLLVSICWFFVMVLAITAEARPLNLTQEEKEYISKNPVLKVITLDGAAPLQYADENGEMQGISRHVMDEISKLTGLVFEYKMVDSLDQVLKEKADIFVGIPYNYSSYSFPDMVLSRPFLKSSTILYVHSSVNANKLNDKIYAAVKGSKLPKGIKEENAIYFNTREESLDAVESGEADYGYGNAYSVVFYTLQNGYNHIVTIPQEKEPREYCLGFINKDKLLEVIINKSLGAISENQMQNIVLDVTSHVERKITPAMLFKSYGSEIAVIAFVVIALLTYGIYCNINSNIKLKVQNKRYEVLAEISNEYLYEYDIKKDLLVLSEKCSQLFKIQGTIDESSGMLKNSLVNLQFKNPNAELLCKPERYNTTYEIKLPLADGGAGTFKVINSSVCDSNGKVEYIIGKLIDISEEAAEKEALISKAQRDGLTGLYNAATSKELIVERIAQRCHGTMDAFLLVDLDLFKNVNDRLGHHTGDRVLQDLARDLKRIFRNTDIIGRLGGDEFCIYMKDIPSGEFVQRKCQQLSKFVHKTIDGVTISVSIGIVLVNETKPYEKVFQVADAALYQAKRNGRGQYVVSR
ncbi:transporter substrate-binding domain-containing diguanylate cyclase [Desulfotomaculum sp. 1211_IL3151]|uniref:transporter substrate-binding domain-containing diguanylate cyclase n=1 Tax=Desulfotomaculum sp. 1211_IL3151 TaxID=3084055 RepID=UPI002FD8A9E2